MDAIAATDMMPILSSPLPNFNMAGRGSSMANLDKTARRFRSRFSFANVAANVRKRRG